MLTDDIKNNGLKYGDIGTVVHCYDDDIGFEVEFLTAAGKTIAVLTLEREDVRPFYHSEILHAREVAAGVA